MPNPNPLNLTAIVPTSEHYHHHHQQDKLVHNYNYNREKNIHFQVEQPNTKGKYVQPFPCASTYYNEKYNKKSSKECVIQCGSKLQPKSINSVKFAFGDTSQIDTIIEVMCVAYKNIKTFKEYCEKYMCQQDNTCLLRIIRDHCNSRTMQKLYNIRALLLYKIVIDKQDTNIFIKDDVGTVFLKSIENHFSLKVIMKCRICNNYICNNVPQLDIRISENEQFFVEKLNDNLNEFL